jgi:hypothetical protein
MIKIRLSMCFAIVLGTTCLSPAHAAVAQSPDIAAYTSWEPFNVGLIGDKDHGLGSSNFNNLVAEIDTPHSQGYHITVRCTNSQAATGYGSCTRANWNAFAENVGIALIQTHGAPGSIIAISVKTERLAREWLNSGSSGSDGLSVHKSTEYTGYVVRAKPAWLAENWSSYFNVNDAIVYISGCESAVPDDGAGSEIFNAVGGRFAIGYLNKVTNTDAAQDITNLFQYMNGIQPFGLDYRLASLAVTDPELSLGLTHRLTGDSTLCPSVASPVLSNISPEGSGTAASGDGKVVFDTKLDTVHYLATDALTYSTASPITISNIRWNGDHEIDFHWQATTSSGGTGGYGKPTFSVTMTAVAAKIVAFPGGQQLDGGDMSTGAPPLSTIGVAPNGDDFKWSFSN